MSLDFAHIRRSVPILDLARRLGLEVIHNRARCIFPERHKNNDRTPSMTINPNSNSFKCWVCDDVKGSVLDLVMLVRGVDVLGAVEYLKQEGLLAGVSDNAVPSFIAAGRPTAPQKPARTVAGTAPEEPAYPHAVEKEERRAKIFEALVNICEGLTPEDFRYLKSRRIFRKTADKMKLCSIRNYEETAARLEQSFDLSELQEAGLYNERDHFRFYKHRLILPYCSAVKVRYFQARAIDPAVTPKELNPSGAIPLPYNIDIVKTSSLVYLCEGVIDALTLIEQGFPAVGIPGARNFKADWVEYFVGKKVYSVFDGDDAGRAGNEKLKSLFGAAKIYFDIIQIPDGSDINDLFTGKRWKDLKR